MKLFNFQQDVVDKATKYLKGNPYQKPFNIFFEMGLGKTIMAIEILNNLKPKTVLIVCPKSLITMWEYNLQKHCTIPFSSSNKQSLLQYPSNNCKIFIVNYEQLHKIEDLTVDMCILDECQKIKNTKSKLHKSLANKVTAAWPVCLTGTPIMKNLMDLFGILTCINSITTVNNLNETRFKYKYILNGGELSYQSLVDSIRDYTTFGRLSTYIDMPGYEDIVIPIKLLDHEYESMQSILHNNKPAFTRATECQQITSDSPAKLSMCISLITDLISDDEKVVLFCKYDKEFDYFMEKFKDVCVGINGKTKDRDTPVYEFQNNKKVKLFIGNLQTAGVGITLTAATKCIIYSETFNWGDMEQARARIYRIGQCEFCTYYHLIAIDSVDEVFYENNINKTDMIEDFKNRFGGI